MSRIFVGTCNWADFPEWYPKGVRPSDRIAYYAQHFNVVEVDSTFYRLMPRRNFEGWAAKTPDNFVFDVKAYRGLTRHGADFEPGKRHSDSDPAYDPAEEDFEKFKFQIEPLRASGKLRAILFQFPPWFRRTQTSFDHIDVCREYLDGYLIAAEFRHRSWLEPAVVDDTLAFLRERKIAYTVVDEPQMGSGTVPPLVAVTNPALAMVRFHGRNVKTWYLKGASSRERFNYLYSEVEMQEWLPRIAEMANSADEVHVLMNNNYGPIAVPSTPERQSYQALINAQDMQRLLALD